jgi:hypothetical protein
MKGLILKKTLEHYIRYTELIHTMFHPWLRAGLALSNALFVFIQAVRVLGNGALIIYSMKLII